MSSPMSVASDWEDLADETFSIISVPTSEQDSTKLSDDGNVADNPLPLRLAPEKSSQDISGIPPLAADSKARPSNSVNVPLEGKAEGKAEDEEKRTQSAPGAHAGLMTAQPLEDPFLDPPAGQDAAGESDDGVQELLDSCVVDPAYFLKVLQSLREMLVETRQTAADLQQVPRRIAERTTSICDMLSAQVAELIPIVSGYAKVWPSSSRDLPLDRNLHSWLSGVRVQLLGLQVELQRLARPHDERAGLDDAVSVLDRHWSELSAYEKQMDDFLPIMQVDFNEFQTQRMTLPSPQPIPDKPVHAPGDPSRSAPIPIPQQRRSSIHSPTSGRLRPSNEIWVLRNELYRLKDEIKRTMELLSDSASALPSSAAALASDIARSYEMLFNTVSLVLSNNGSDWIEYGLSGGLTYAEFANMDADIIRDFASTLHTIWSKIDVDSIRRADLWTPQMVDNHRRQMLLADGQLDQLETLVEVLTATMSPTRG